jgi:hypothetical protein
LLVVGFFELSPYISPLVDVQLFVQAHVIPLAQLLAFVFVLHQLVLLQVEFLTKSPDALLYASFDVLHVALASL